MTIKHFFRHKLGIKRKNTHFCGNKVEYSTLFTAGYSKFRRLPPKKLIRLNFDAIDMKIL